MYNKIMFILVLVLVLMIAPATLGVTDDAKTAGYHNPIYTDTITNYNGLDVITIIPASLQIDAGLFTFRSVNGDLRFIDDTDERLVIDATGRIGIGKNDPGTNLDVLGSISATSQVRGSSAHFNNTMDSGSVTTGTLNAAQTDIVSGDEALTISNSGTTGSHQALAIYNGESNPTAYIQFDGTFSGDGSGLTNSGEWVRSSTHIKNRNSGNVGIGLAASTDPSSKLHVLGTVTGTNLAATSQVSGSSANFNNNMDSGSVTTGAVNGSSAYFTGNMRSGSINTGPITAGAISASTVSSSSLDNTVVIRTTGGDDKHALSVGDTAEHAWITADGTFSGTFVGDGSGLDGTGPWDEVSATQINYPGDSGVAQVGIGKANPTQALDVVGSGVFSSSVFAPSVRVGSGAGTTAISADGSGGVTLTTLVDGTPAERKEYAFASGGTFTIPGKIRVRGNAIQDNGVEDRLTFSSTGTTVSERLTLNGAWLGVGGLDTATNPIITWNKDGVTQVQYRLDAPEIRLNGVSRTTWPVSANNYWEADGTNSAGETNIARTGGDVRVHRNLVVDGDLTVKGRFTVVVD